MSTDTRPSVTVVGELCFVEKDGACYIDVAYVPPDLDLRDGDTVDVTIRKHEPASEEQEP